MGCVVSSVSCKVCRVSVCPVSCVVWAWGETRNDLCAFVLLLYFTFESGCITRIKIGPGNSTQLNIQRSGLSGVRGPGSTLHTSLAHTATPGRRCLHSTHLAGCVTAKALQTRTRLTLLSAHTRLHTPQPRHTARTHARCAARALDSAPVSPHMPLHSHATRVWLQAPLP